MARLTRLTWIILGLLILSAIALFAPLPKALQAVFGFLQTFYLPGIVFLAFLGDPERTSFDSLFFPPLLSPIILILLVMTIQSFTGSFFTSVKISIIVLYILLIASILAGKFERKEKPSTVPVVIPLISLFFIGIIAASYIANDYLFSHDTVRHSAVVREILYRGVPPMEPFFIDVPIRSMWFQHFFQAIWKTLSGLSIFHSMWIVNLVGIAIFPYLIARLTAYFTAKRRYILATPFFAIAGLDAPSWILWPIHLFGAFTGEIRGREEIARIMGGIDFNSLFISGVLKPPMTFALNILDKYLTIDVLHLSLNLFLLCFIIILARDFQKKHPFRAGIQIFLIMSGVLLIRIVTGMVFVLAAILTGIISMLPKRVWCRERLPRYQSLIIPVLGMLVLVAGLFLYRSLTGEFADGHFVPDRPRFNAISLVTIIAPLIVLLPFSFRAVREIFSSDTFEYRTLGTWLAALFITSISLDVIGSNESYAIFLLFLLLVGPVAWLIMHGISNVRGIKRTLLIVWIAVLFMAPPIITIYGYTHYKPKIKHQRIRYRITPDERALYEWIRDETDIEAIIAERNEYNVMPYYAHRRNFYMTTHERYNFGYLSEKAEKYRAIRDELFSDCAISPSTIDFLRDFTFDIYLVVWTEDLEAVPELETKFSACPERFERVYENPAGTVYRLVR